MAAITPQDIQAQHEINLVLRNYCRSMDRIDAALGYTIWHEDGIADYGPLFQGTGRQFIDWVCEFHRTLVSHSHLIGNVLINLQGDRAGSETYISVALLSNENGKHKLNSGRGRYLDEWSRRDGRWAIDRRRFMLDYSFVQEVEPILGWGARDLTDPSYPLLGPVGAA